MNSFTRTLDRSFADVATCLHVLEEEVTRVSFVLLNLPDELQRLVVKDFTLLVGSSTASVGPEKILSTVLHSTFVIDCTTIITAFLVSTVRFYDVVTFSKGLTRLLELSKCLGKLFSEFVQFIVRKSRFAIYCSLSLGVEFLELVVLSFVVLTDVITQNVSVLVALVYQSRNIEAFTESSVQNVAERSLSVVLFHFEDVPEVDVVVSTLTYRSRTSLVGEEEVVFSIVFLLLGVL